MDKTSTSPFTVELLEKFAYSNAISDAIKYAQSYYPEYPSKPAKPHLPSQHTSDDVEQYRIELVNYEKQYSEYAKKVSDYTTEKRRIDLIIEKYIKKEACLDEIPMASREKVWQRAWEEGHATGYYDVYLELVNLIGLF